MKVTRQQVVTVVGFIVSSLLLVFAACCSLEKRTMCGSEQKHTEDGSGGHHVAEEPSEKVGFVANIFCCHGESERHRSDEDNITPPEIMYPRAKINPTCMMCHPRHEIRHEIHHKKLLAGAKTVFDSADEDGDQMYCTDCHAKHHRINFRTIRWNKETGELLNE